MASNLETWVLGAIASQGGVVKSIQDADPALEKLHQYITSNLPHHPARRGAIYLVRSLSDKYDRLPASIILTEVHYDPRIAVAQSESANVHKGTYKKEDVAVKKIRFGLITNAEKRKKAVAAYHREVVTWAYVEHANILPFRGVCAGADIKNTIFTIVTPWVQQDLDDYVQGPHYRANYGRLYLTLAKALASGLAYLHAQKFVHGDVKASNIRVRDDGTLLLADFGHAIVGDITRGSYTGTGSVSSNGWQAPEACDSTSKKRTSAMDVYGYGCVCYMLASGNKMFHDSPNREAAQKLMKTQDPDIPIGLDGRIISSTFFRLMTKCWSKAPEGRWTMSNVRAHFGVVPVTMKDLGHLFKAYTKMKCDGKRSFELKLKEGEEIEIINCVSNVCWQARAQDGAVGYVFNPEVKLGKFVICRAKYVKSTTDKPSANTNFPALSLQVNDEVDVLMFEYNTWLVRHQFTDPSTKQTINVLGVVHSQWMDPIWPDKDLSTIRPAVVQVSYSPSLLWHLQVLEGDNIKVQARHRDQAWQIGRIGAGSTLRTGSTFLKLVPECKKLTT